MGPFGSRLPELRDNKGKVLVVLGVLLSLTVIGAIIGIPMIIIGLYIWKKKDSGDSAEDDGIWKPCPNCGSTNVRKDRWELAINADVVCQDCGHREDARSMNTRMEGIEKPSFREANSDIGSKESGLELTPQQQLWQNIGNLLVVLGILISLTVVGAVIGIPMIIAGMLISSKGSPDIDEIEFTCPECGAELEHDTRVCPECGEDGLRLNKSRSLRDSEKSD